MKPYEDMLDLERPVSPKHPPMPRAERAKQFMPFASLRGFGDVITDRETIRDARRLLSEDERDTIDARLREIAEDIASGIHPLVTVSVFVADTQRSDGMEERGSYDKVTGRADKLRTAEREIRVGGTYYSLERIDEICFSDPEMIDN